MSKKHVGKKFLSVTLVLALIFGMFGSYIGEGLRVAKAAEPDDAKVLEEELKGYRRITATDFEKTNYQRYGKEYTLANGANSNYVGNYNGKTYLDVDVNFNGLTTGGQVFLRYMSDRDTNSMYQSAFALRVYQDATAGNIIYFGYQDESKNLVNFVNSVQASDYGISKSATWLNVKLLTDIKEDAEDTTKEVIDYQLWIENIFVCEGSITENAHSRSGLRAQVGTSGISVRTPRNIDEELAGYKRITMADYDHAVDATGVANFTHGDSATYQGAGFDKTYLDIDVNFNGLTQYGSANLRYQASGKWTDSYALGWLNGDTTLHFFRYKSDTKTETISNTLTAADYGITSATEYFNVKIRTDIQTDASDEKIQTVDIQLWLNNKLAWEGTIEETRNDASRQQIWASSGSGKISVRTPRVLSEELEGYRQIQANDFENPTTHEGYDAEYTLANNERTGYIGDYYGKTYLDVDLQFGGTVTYNKTELKYMSDSSSKYKSAFGFSAYSNVIYFGYQDENTKKDTVVPNTTVKIADYGISSVNDSFNVKLLTNIQEDSTDATKDVIEYQFWLNDQFVCEGSFAESKHQNGRTGMWPLIQSGTSVSVKSSLNLSDELDDYHRVTIEDIDGLGASRAETGTEYKGGKAGKYSGGSFDKTYLDMDVRTNAGIFLTYLMTPYVPDAVHDATYVWGNNNRYQFTLSGTNLNVQQVLGTNVITKSFDMSTVGYAAGDMFNLKVRTDVETVADSTIIRLQFWINDQYLGKSVFTETTSRDRSYLGIRGTAANTTIVRTPMNHETLADKSYDLSTGSYLLAGADYFYVNGKKTPQGTELTTPNDYMIERIVDGEVVSTQCVSLYYLGDINLDGSAFEAGEPVWKDFYALEGVINYGTPMKAVLKAADINNDGEVTQEDLTLFTEIRKDITKKDSILSTYRKNALFYDYLGGSEVMPIGGYYGPYDDITITDEMFKWIKESGINLITFTHIDCANDTTGLLQQALALAEKYGIGVYVTDSGLNMVTANEDGQITRTTKTTAAEIAQQIAAYSLYDSFLGINIVDEPKELSDTSIKSYQYYQEITQALKRYNNVTGYLNLNGSVAFSRKNVYSDYVEESAQDVDMLSFDNYPFYDNDTAHKQNIRISNYLESLDTIRQKAQDNNIPFMSYVQAGTDYRDNGDGGVTVGTLTAAQTRWNVNTSLAYGAKGIAWFTLLQPRYYAFLDKTDENNITYDYNRNGIIGANNQKNQYYTMVETINKQIAAIDEVLMKAENTGVIVTGTAADNVSTASKSGLTSEYRNHTFTGIKSQTDGAYTKHLQAVSNGNAMIGCFDYQDTEAFYVVNYNYDNTAASQTITLTLNGNYRYRMIQDAETTYGEGGEVSLTISSGEGVLVVLEDYVKEYTPAEFAACRAGETYTAPNAPAGFAFAGWFVDEGCTQAVDVSAKAVSQSVYAKFVDETLLDVKAQIPAGTTAASASTNIRFVSAVDTLDYQKVGFVIEQEGMEPRDRSSKVVYAALSVYYQGDSTSYTPDKVFCGTATRFKTYTLNGVPSAKFGVPFEVTAYWITLDGTRVEGPKTSKVISSVLQ